MASLNTSETNASYAFPNLLHHCIDHETSAFICLFFTFIKLLAVLPLSVLVLSVGYRRWRRRRSFQTASHADVFTYHAAVLEMVFVLSAVLYLCSFHSGSSEAQIAAAYVSVFVWSGEIFLHILTCVERYLAAVHPVTYLALRHSGGIRTTSIGCVYLFSFAWIALMTQYVPNIPYIPYFCFLVISLVIVSFCSVSVLCVLIRPGPGEGGGDRKRLDQSKKRAFLTISAILGVLLGFFCGTLIGLIVEKSQVLGFREGCVVLLSMYWLCLPNALVLPLLFLHRARRKAINEGNICNRSER